eukprot:NODE_5090_length_613_cov_310.503584.p1 GENE.NODE_5090_length_613_cov_310.503584~~NODE_5090_length_613_cov_310.503584.p1  ORF type:complete len:155 (+),score=38.40 NODE_5090_length_613_cov_310.503584:3-467(+)
MGSQTGKARSTAYVKAQQCVRFARLAMIAGHAMRARRHLVSALPLYDSELAGLPDEVDGTSTTSVAEWRLVLQCGRYGATSLLGAACRAEGRLDEALRALQDALQQLDNIVAGLGASTGTPRLQRILGFERSQLSRELKRVTALVAATQQSKLS